MVKKIKQWEISLRASRKLTEATLAIAKQHAQWKAFSAQGAAALAENVISFKHIEWQYMTCAMSGVSKHVPIAATAVEVTEEHLEALNRYKLILSKMEVTADLVLTDAQRRVLEPLIMPQDGTWQVWWSYRLSDTGATAICLKNGVNWMTLYEDGSITKNLWIREAVGSNKAFDSKHPDLGGSWYFNKKIKRDYTPPAPSYTIDKKAAKFEVRRK